MVKCESLRINVFRITHTGKSVNFPVTICYLELFNRIIEWRNGRSVDQWNGGMCNAIFD